MKEERLIVKLGCFGERVAGERPYLPCSSSPHLHLFAGKQPFSLWELISISEIEGESAVSWPRQKMTSRTAVSSPNLIQSSPTNIQLKH